MKNTYTELIGKHQGESCVILGAGPSLYDLCVSKYLKDILNHVVISVNSAFVPISDFDLNPDRHYWVSNDVLCRRWSYWEKVDKSKCTKVVRDSWLKYRGVMSNTLYFAPRPTAEDVVNPDDVGLCYNSSIPTSIDLAMAFGCKKIILFGVDQNTKQGMSHYWQMLYKREDRPFAFSNIQDSWSKQQKVFDINNGVYDALRKFADLKGVEIYNCSSITKVTAFDRITLDYAFKIVGK
jgi:hypothetical protein